jgi:hypothetical protein
MNPEQATTFEDLVEKSLPDVFGPNALHNCLYRDLVLEFVREDLQKKSTDRLSGLSIQRNISIHN